MRRAIKYLAIGAILAAVFVFIEGGCAGAFNLKLGKKTVGGQFQGGLRKVPRKVEILR